MKLYSIQFLRAIAATLVIYTHSLQFQIENSVSFQQNFFYLQNFGCIGVDLFFVISGFIITYVVNKYNGVQQGMFFLLKRFIRINPVYYIASLLFLAALYFKSWILHKPFYSFYKIINSFSDTVLVIPTLDELKYYQPIMIMGWTLAFEWLFYILSFFAIIINWRNKIAILITLATVLVLTGIIFNASDYRLIFISNPIILEFILGVIICGIYINTKVIPVSISSLSLSVGLITWVILIFYGYGDVWLYKNVLNGELSYKRFLLWGIPCSLIVAGCVFLEKSSKYKNAWNNKWIGFIGEASYSIYLVHPLVLLLLELLYKVSSFSIPPDIRIIFQIVTAIIISVGFYFSVEKPFINVSNKLIQDKIKAGNGKRVEDLISVKEQTQIPYTNSV